MLRIYIKTAFRHFVRNKWYSLINITGLSIGISAALVIFLMVGYDLGFDKFQKNPERVYRVVSDMKFPGSDFKNAGIPLPMVPAMQSKLTGVEKFISISTLYAPTTTIQLSGKSVPATFKKRPGVIYANDGYLEFLSYEWLAGDPSTALANPFSVVLTESAARTYFPDEQLTHNIGKIVVYNDSIRATVTGIVKDLTQRTDFNFKEFISYSSLPQAIFSDPSNWGGVSSSDQLFIRLANGQTPATMTKQIQAVFDSHQKDAFLKNEFSLQPLGDIHFNAGYGNFDQRLAHKPTLYGLMVVACILLLLGCINFINLSTAQAVKRAKEIGVRKTMGGSKPQLLVQLLSETFLLTVLAALLSMVLVPVILSVFSDFIPAGIHASSLGTVQYLLFALALVAIVTVLAGFYPAIVLSGYKPVLVMKNQAMAGASSRTAWIRKSLTVSQFVIAQAFVIAALVVGSQIQFMLHKDIGFKKDGIVVISTPEPENEWKDIESARKSAQTRKVLMKQIESLPGVQQVCLAGMPPSAAGYNMQTMKFFDGKKDIDATVEIKHIDAGYVKLYKLRLIAGTGLQDSDSTREYLVNESYARLIGFKNVADAVGKTIRNGDANIPIVGVVADFNSTSLHNPIKPLVFSSVMLHQTQIHVALEPQTKPGQWSTSISKMEALFRDIYPGENFEDFFVDDSIRKFYESEQKTATLLNWATGLAILISCLGLLGLVMFTTSLRTKEIGVRKVLGASVVQILSLLSKDFLKLVGLAFILAVPLVWWGIHKWFEGFAFHTSINLWLFVAAGLGMALIAFVTLSFQTIRAATANPVEALKTE